MGRADKSEIDRLNIGENRGVPVARIFEMERPFDRGEIEILDPDAAEDQTGLGLSVGQRVFGSLLVELAGRPLEGPSLE